MALNITLAFPAKGPGSDMRISKSSTIGMTVAKLWYCSHSLASGGRSMQCVGITISARSSRRRGMFLALTLASAAFAGNGEASTVAWVELIAPSGAPSVRVITDEGACPALRVDGEQVQMEVRVGKGKKLFPDD